MKIYFFLIGFVCQMSFSQGKLSGEFKDIIGLKFKTEKDIPQLSDFKYIGGSIISDLEILNSYRLSLDVYRKDKTAIVILSKLVDLSTNESRIIEVLKIIDVSKNYEIRTFGCSFKNMNPDYKIVAVYYIGNKKKVKSIKEAFVLKDIRFEIINPRNVKCINEIE